MSGLLPLRSYQRDAIDAVRAAWRRGMVRPAEVLFTGAGKTVIFSHLSAEWLAENPGRRVLIIVHTQELLDQALDKLRSVAPGLRVGAVQAQRNETLARVIVATVQTLRSPRRRAMIRDVGLVIVDECHHAVATSYREVLSHFGVLGLAPGEAARAVCVGYTATMTRADQLALGDVWQDVVYTRTITDGIGDGFLVRPRGIHVQVDDLDLSSVKTTRGDYREGELGEAIEASMAPEAIAKAVTEHADSRKILLFAPTVSSATVIADALSASGRSVGLIHGALPTGERKAVLSDFRADRTQVLANCMVLTEGFDEPAADCVVLARPTKSQGLYIQIAGRVLRPYPGKTDALILDVVGATRLHGLVAGIELFGEAPKLPQDPDETSDEFENPDELDEGQQDARAALGVDGPLVSTEVDLFAASSSRWLRTRAGVFFIPAGDRYIAVLPSPPSSPEAWMDHFAGRGGLYGYDVVTMHKSQLRTERAIVRGVPDLSYAMAWAEGDVTPSEKTTAAKDRSWQARPPTEKMRGLAERLHIYVPPGARMGEVSNMITLALATKRIDHHLPAYLRGTK
jgi:superfamily II DNA or RNA helicase